jgi:hypothetical protein
MVRWPSVILKAHLDGSGLVVVGDGEGMVDGVNVEFVKVWLHGAASRLAIEEADGRLVQLAYHGRDGTMKVGDSVRTFTSYATVDGVTLPTAYAVTFNGKELDGVKGKIDAFEINAKLPAELFDVDHN